MKRWISWIVALTCLVGGFAAASEKKNVFEFRNGITWDMAMKEVLETEGIPLTDEEDAEYYFEELMSGVELIGLEDVEVSEFEADLSYVFVQDSLQMCLYELSMDEEEVEYLSGALKTKYGQEPVETNEFLYEMMRRLVPELYEEENPFGNGLCWHLLDGTVVQLVPMKDSDDYGLAYMNYDVMSEMLDELATEEYNLFGL